MSEQLLILDNITKYYGNFKAVDNLSFNLIKGQILGFLGLNGSGKTTTIKLMAGLLYNYTGSLYYKGEKVKNIGNKPETTFIFDSQNFYENLTAYENLLIASCLNKKYTKNQIKEVLEEIGLKDWINKPVKIFSRGMKQRLALSIALLLNPEFLILDEPTNGLDIDGIYFCEKFFQKLVNQGCTILLSSHYLEEVERLADHIVIIHKGIKKFDGDKQSLSSLKTMGVKYTFSNQLNKDALEKLNTFLIQNNIKTLDINIQEYSILLTFEKDSINYVEIINKYMKDNFSGLLFIEPIQKHLKELFFIK